MTDNGWESMCYVQVFEESGQTLSVQGFSPTWSPDGLRLAFTDGSRIYVHDRVSGITETVSDSIPYVESLSWARNGARIAVSGWSIQGDGTWGRDLFGIDPAGSGLAYITSIAGFNGGYAWSPSGNAIAFARQNGGVQELYLANADGSNARRLTSEVGFRGAISWSPDGTRIAFDCLTSVCAVNTDGTGVVQLGVGPGDATTAVFSPTGGRLAYVAGTSGRGDLVVQEADGTATLVAPGMRASLPSWSQDGAALAFVITYAAEGGACNADGSPCGQPDATFVVNPDGTGLKMIGYGTNPAWSVALRGQPIATFTGECTGATCRFDSSGSFDADGAIASYEWNFGDGTTGSGPSPNHAFATGSTYSVTLTVTDTDGLRDVTSRTFEANAAPVASFTASCTGPSCTLDGNGSSDPDGTVSGYYWAFGDGTFFGSDYLYPQAGPASVTHSYATGTFTATLYVRDNGGTYSATTARTFSVLNTPLNTPPVASFTAACIDLNCVYDASASSDPDGTQLYFRWDLGADTLCCESILRHRYLAAGTYTVGLTVIDASGAETRVSGTVTVTAPPADVIHVGDLDGSSVNQQKTWTAEATVTLHTAAHAPAANVTVRGVWEDGSAASCITDVTGVCAVQRYAIARKTSKVSFTVTGATVDSYLYDAGANHDADGSSNGTTIRITRAQ